MEEIMYEEGGGGGRIGMIRMEEDRMECRQQ